MLPGAPPGWASTAKMRRSPTDGSGTTCVHVAPRSWLTATPQSVPAKTSSVPGTNEIPQVLKREVQVGSAVGGFCQLAPPSVLRQIPPPFVVRLSPQAEARTSCASSGSNLTSDIRKG